ncbi:MAG TPA: NAD(P)/FAD-dependent oxidoreductase [Myxococcaceae bacterium]|nr:NAD(P)/FAD-dependent oxidoreductase [Myxococcaceae bacterium]
MPSSPTTSGTVVIIGAGPAGLTAAYELLTRTSYKVVVLEKSQALGGISRTVRYKGNRIDIGGHRFFSKSDRVMQWWLDKLPLQAGDGSAATLSYQNQHRDLEVPRDGADPDGDQVMLLRPRQSRIYYRRRFFDYPVSLSPSTILNLGLWRTTKIGLSYLQALARPIRDEQNLEEFFINRFGRELYLTFFKDYTEKVWGRPCTEISAAWGAQRIKGLDIVSALKNAARGLLPERSGDLQQRDTETSLIERFLYPKFGPGQMWEEVAKRVEQLGGTLLLGRDVVGLEREGERIRAVLTRDDAGEETRHEADLVFSTMPIRELVRGLSEPPPADVAAIADGLPYRDFLTVGLLLSDLRLKEREGGKERIVGDNWIYVQEPEVEVGRLQIFNNWSPAMVADPSRVWVGLEYFCNEGDALWAKPDADLIAQAEAELLRIGIIDPGVVEDAVVVRQEKAYPAYFGTHDRFDTLRGWLDGLENLVLIGRNGMHRYNNQDHSMLTAMVAVDQLLGGDLNRDALWSLNTEAAYHEEKGPSSPAPPRGLPTRHPT